MTDDLAPATDLLPLVAFLRARLDEREHTAHAAVDELGGARVWRARRGEVYIPLHLDERRYDPGIFSVTMAEPAVATHIAANDPQVTLKQIAAHRRTLDRHTPHSMGECRVCTAPHWGTLVCNHCYACAWPCPDLIDLAAIWDDHPDYARFGPRTQQCPPQP